MTAVLSYLFTGTTPFLNFSLQDYAYRALFTLVYLKVRNPIRPTWGEWSWSLPAGLFYNVPLPAIQLWSLLTVFADGWGTSMRGSKEVEEEARWKELKKRAWEVGFFVVWMGVMGGVVGRWVSGLILLDFWQRMACIGASALVSSGGFGCWMITME